MSKLRKYRRGLVTKNIKVAYAMEHMVKVAGSYAAVRDNFKESFENAFVQKEKETYEAKASSSPAGQVAT